ncbi:MAG: reverse transcriptase domain-containing protein, partial [Candidatus Thiodiazotropha sp.]
SSFVETENYRSAVAEDKRAHVEKQILTELENGRYRIVNRKSNIISALGAIPKKDSGNVRLIHDASRPAGQALNNFATTHHFKYQFVQDAVHLVTHGCYFAKLDLANAYRCVKIHPSNYKATGLKWRFKGDSHDTYLIDERLPFGASKSPQIFNRITQSVRAIMDRKGYKTIICYLDDFLIVAQTYDECLQALNALLRLLRQLGFQINYSKIEGPCQSLTFLGIVLDSNNMTLSIPDSKLREVEEIMKQILKRKKVTKRDIQSLVGKLNWITQCIYGGRYHMRRLIDRSNTLRKSWHRTLVTKEMKQDIIWWLEFMSIFNGTMKMVDNRPATPVSIDACKIAGGAFYCGDFIYTPWTNKAALLPINYLEVLSLEPAAQRWAPCWANRKVYVHCDNVTACHIINKGSSKNPTVMASLRRIFWLSALYNFRIHALYYPGPCNSLADRASRLHEPDGLNKPEDHWSCSSPESIHSLHSRISSSKANCTI